MPDRSVVTRFEAKIDGYLGGVAKMAGATEKFAKTAATSAQKHKADWDKIGKTAIVGGAALGAVVLGAAKAYADFEQAMSGVAAVADATAKQQKQLGEAAIKAGQDTVFSATEAAKAEAELAKAGVGVSDILGGALRGSLDLAAAGQIDLAQSAEISAQAMNIFNKSGSDVGHIADVLTAGANKSAAGVDDLGMALQQGGLVAKQTGLSLEDAVGTLAAFADNALKGSDAGTSLKTMLQRLNPQSLEAATLMDELGLRAYDAQGNFVGVAEYAGKLQSALGDMSAEQRNAALSTLFGSDAVRGANVLMEQGEVGIRKYIAAVDDQGAAQRMAARQTDNLKGDIEQLKGTLESAFIRGGAGGNSGVRELVQDVTSLVNKFNELPPSTQANIVKAIALASALLLVGGGAVKATTSILAMKASMDAAGLSSARLAAISKTLGAAAIVVGIAAVASELIKIKAASSVASVSIDDLATSLDGLSKGGQVTGALAVLFRDENGIFGDEKYVSAAEAIERFGNSANDALGDSLYSKFVRLQDLGSTTEVFEKQVSQLDQALAQMVQSGHADEAKSALDRLTSGMDPKVATAAREKLTAYSASLDEVAVASSGAAAAGIQLPPLETAIAKTAEQAAAETKAFADELDALNSPLLDAREAARNFEAAIDDAAAALKDNGKTLDIHTAAGRANQAALDDVASAAIDQIAALQANGASQGKMQATLEASKARLVTVGERFGLTKAQAKAYADQVLKIPATKNTVASFRVTGLSDLQAAGNYLKNLKDKKVVLTVGTVKVGNTQVNAGKFADGGPAIGPGTATSDSIPALLSNNEHVLTASDVEKAGGHAAIYRMRHGIQSGALRFAGGGAVLKAGRAAFADGGEVDFSAILELLRNVTTGQDVTDARGTNVSKRAAYLAAKNALASLHAQQRKAARDLASARRSGDRDRVSDILDRQRVLLGKVAAAEGKLTVARNASAAASKNAAAIEKKYAADRAPLLDRTIKAGAASNGVSKAFLDNIDRLTQMGFGSLALQLLDMGGPEAQTIAAQAVKSAAKAGQLQAQFSASASLSAREAAIRAALSGTSELGVLGPAAGFDYAQVRDLSGVLRAPAASSGAPIVFAPQITVEAGVGDPVAIGAAVENVLVNYQNATGNDLKFTASPS